jgi:hypothetical protein
MIVSFFELDLLGRLIQTEVSRDSKQTYLINEAIHSVNSDFIFRPVCFFGGMNRPVRVPFLPGLDRVDSSKAF